MKRLVICLLLALYIVPSAFAQGFMLGAGGGGLVSLGENSFAYVREKKPFALLAPQGNLWVQYNFNQRLGLRLNFGGGDNAGAKNYMESHKTLKPYRYSSLNGFLDFMVDPRGRHTRLTKVIPTLFVGAGLGYTFNFKDNMAFFQPLTDPNIVFGFRAGAMLAFPVSKALDIYIEGCIEAYTDTYNGLRPNAEDQEVREGYAGFPFDLRIPLSVGVRWRL